MVATIKRAKEGKTFSVVDNINNFLFPIHIFCRLSAGLLHADFDSIYCYYLINVFFYLLSTKYEILFTNNFSQVKVNASMFNGNIWYCYVQVAVKYQTLDDWPFCG